MKKQVCFEVDENGCWNCTSHRTSNGYPGFYRNGRHMRLNRYMWETLNGPIPDGLLVRHRCDNRRCINPEHLEVGTAKENHDDMVSRGRRGSSGRKGEMNHQAKLRDADIPDILRRLAGGESQASIARDYKVNRVRIHEIATRKSWTHIERSFGGFVRCPEAVTAPGGNESGERSSSRG